MPALIAKLIPIAIFALVVYWLLKEMEAADRRRDELKDNKFWKFFWPAVNIWLKIKRSHSILLWLIRAVVFMAVVYIIVSMISSR
ncbi:hypothetical protein A2V49_04720 [candidate division WWE3 bacterium RBG_19FT_COMBO_34_6]|uniref:Uncharacterized protein n=1 Tax=candidate division WWE3 bacterium RBG_19FT_COMBO_34_6 TaxID=1802612 RepID=A0A1F4UJM9_UNCKA|nr:MAG: hypothetical protein A2V49_04720 [candidate division WWE3 bacterium RBG_19FT_COMBO_34_6]